MTDMRKPEFKLTVSSVEIKSTDPLVVQLIKAEQLPLEKELTILSEEEKNEREGSSGGVSPGWFS